MSLGKGDLPDWKMEKCKVQQDTQHFYPVSAECRPKQNYLGFMNRNQRLSVRAAMQTFRFLAATALLVEINLNLGWREMFISGTAQLTGNQWHGQAPASHPVDLPIGSPAQTACVI
jgi:hypothetical protein